MAGAQLKVHVISNMKFQRLEELVGWIADDVRATINAPAERNGDRPKLMGLAFTDPDGESHVYVFTDEGKQNLIRQLTGGLVVPSG